MSGGLVSAFDWRETNDLWVCSLIFYDKVYEELALTPGTILSFRVLGGRYCTGYYASSGRNGFNFDSVKSLHPCPYNLEITKGISCMGCRNNDVMISCIRCDGSYCNTSIDVQENCINSTAYVYLAAFRNRIKAGVSRDRRVLKRWIEQGADAARIVLRGNGREVRQYEKKIQIELGAANHVRSNQKIIPAKRTSIDVSLKLLDDYASRVFRLFPDSDKVHEEPVNLLPFYRLPDFKGRPMSMKIQTGSQVYGSILGVKGPILYFEIASQTYALDIHRLLTRKIILDDNKPLNVQSGLRRFFL